MRDRTSALTTMGKRRHSKASKKKEEEEDLNRFAGSSEEEESESENDEAPDVNETAPPQRSARLNDEDEHESPDDTNVNDDDDVIPVDDDDDMVVASGMAAAMSKILETHLPKHSKESVVLSKTTTPLQRMALKEKQLQKEQREKRRANRERNLTALHIPLSVATSRDVTEAGQTVAMELEQERTHRRVATRGVVALFNAIAQHQKKASEIQPPTSGKSEGKQEVKKLSKHGFLDMIKSAAAAKSENATREEAPSKETEAAPKNKWNALQDDYMLNSKLKDWDKESSDEEQDANEDWASDDGEKEEEPIKKKRRLSAQ